MVQLPIAVALLILAVLSCAVAETLFDFNVVDGDGNSVSLANYRSAKVLLVGEQAVVAL